MVSMVETVRIVHKTRYDEQTYLSIPAPQTPLPKSSLRTQTRLIGLSNNNLAYCAAGTVLHWWDAFPVPSAATALYATSGEYGIAPGWGYATVIDTTIDDISKGEILYGFLPMSTHTFDLMLQPSEIAGHWIEISPHRSKVMSMYQRYEVMPTDFNVNSSVAGWTVALIRCEAGMALAKYVFPQDDKIPIHPFGKPISPWTTKEADLTDTCFVSIGSGTKTAKAFIWFMANSFPDLKPKYRLVEITSGAGCADYLDHIPFEHVTIPYGSVSSNMFPSSQKYVLLHFGARGNTFEEVYDTIQHNNPAAEIVAIQIGSEPKVATSEALAKRQEFMAKIKAVQMNTTAIRDEAVKLFGESQFFQALERGFEALVEEQTRKFDGKVLGMTLQVGHGLQTEDGIGGFWKLLLQGQISLSAAMVIKL